MSLVGTIRKNLASRDSDATDVMNSFGSPLLALMRHHKTVTLLVVTTLADR